MASRYKKDIEAGEISVGDEFGAPEIRHGSVTPAHEIARARAIQNAIAPLRFLSRGEMWLDEKMGIETQGIDRIPEEEKRPPSIWNAFLLWWSLVCHVGTLPIGLLGPVVYGLSLQQSVAMTVAGVMTGALCTAYTGTIGPVTGLRAIATSRYSFGFWGAKLCSVLNIVVGGGFAVVNFVTTSSILSAVSDYTLTLSVGCVIIAVVSYVVSIFGFRIIHTYERYSWIAAFILLCVMLGQVAPNIGADTPGQNSGLGFSGAMLTFFALNFSQSSGWCSIASDYYCNYHATTKRWKIFSLTWLGISTSTIFTTVVGVCIGNAAIQTGSPLADAYDSHGFGGLVRNIYHPIGWSKFCLVILTFSVLGNNIAIIYSSGLSLQLLGHYFHAVPRFIWSFLFTMVIMILSIAGKDSLANIVSNFVSLLGYWTVSFTFILLIEDQWFRKGHPEAGYNLAVWDQAWKLPMGLAAITSLLAGYLAGGLTGMAQVWYTGPIAGYFGPIAAEGGAYGGDVGVFMSGAITIVTFFPLRYLERKFIGR